MTPEEDAEYNRLCAIVAAHEAAEQEASLRSSSEAQKKDKGKEKVPDHDGPLLDDRPTFPQHDAYDEDHAADLEALMIYEAEEEERERKRRSEEEKTSSGLRTFYPT